MRSIYPRLPIDEEKAVQWLTLSGTPDNFRILHGVSFQGNPRIRRGVESRVDCPFLSLCAWAVFCKKALSLGGFEIEVRVWFQLHRKITLRLLSDTVLTRSFVASVWLWSLIL